MEEKKENQFIDADRFLDVPTKRRSKTTSRARKFSKNLLMRPNRPPDVN